VIANEDINEASKMKQIQKLYRKEKDKHKETKNYVVNRSFNANGASKNSRLIKHVDARMRRDSRNEKLRSKKKGKKGAKPVKKPKTQRGGGRPKR
jgi:hypothetical protein